MEDLPAIPAPPDAVARAIDALAPAKAARLWALRRLVFDVAARTPDVGPLTETLKWGEPAYLTQATRAGSTLRIGPIRGHEDCVAIFVNCRTVLADTFRARFGDHLHVVGDRAVQVGLSGPLDDALSEVVALTLTYNRWRNKR